MKKENILENKTILLVNAGSIKKKFILQKLKKLGLKVIVLDSEKKTWAEPFVGDWIITNNKAHAKAIDDLENYLSSNPAIKIDGVITFWEDDVLLTSKISDKFNLIGTPQKIAKIARNKFLFRQFCEENNISFPKFALIKNSKDLEKIAEDFSFPAVIKPTYGSSSAFVVKVNDKDELKEVYAYIKKNISNSIESALSEGLEIMIEEYIDGDEVDIDILLQNGKVKYYAIVDNYKTEEPFFIETQQAIPSELPEKNQDDLIEMAEKVLEKIGIQNGCIHFEAKATSKGPVPLEVNLRMGGDETYMFSREAWRVDLIEGALKIAFGVYLEKNKKSTEPFKYLISHTFSAENSGILIKLDINEKVSKNKHIEELNLLKKVGDPVLVPPEGYEYLGWTTVSGDNALDAEDNLEELLAGVKYEIAEFDSDSSLGKTERKSRFSSAVLGGTLLTRMARIKNINRSAIGEKNIRLALVFNSIKDGSCGNFLVADDMKKIQEILKNKGYKTIMVDMLDPIKALNELKNTNVDLIYNFCDSADNSPHVSAMFELLQIPFTGSDFMALAICLDKIKTKKLLEFHEIPTPEWDYVYNKDDEIEHSLRFPMIVKSAIGEESDDVEKKAVVYDKIELRKKISDINKRHKAPVLLEEYIEGDEYGVFILGNEDNDIRILPLSRYVFGKTTNDKKAFAFDKLKVIEKETAPANNIIIQCPPKNISKRLESLISEIALDTYRIVGCKDYGHVKIKVDDFGNPFVIGLSASPLIGSESDFLKSARLIGMDYAELLEEIIWLAINRYKGNFLKNDILK